MLRISNWTWLKNISKNAYFTITAAGYAHFSIYIFALSLWEDSIENREWSTRSCQIPIVASEIVTFESVWTIVVRNASGGQNFNQDISSWIVIIVYNMSGMFNGAEHFNQDIFSLDVSNVTDMTLMFNLLPSSTKISRVGMNLIFKTRLVCFKMLLISLKIYWVGMYLMW